MGGIQSVEDMDHSRSLPGSSKGSMFYAHHHRFRLVERCLGNYYSGDGIQYGGDKSIRSSGHCGWLQLYSVPDVQLGAWVNAYAIGIIATVRGLWDAVRVFFLERWRWPESHDHSAFFSRLIHGQFYDPV
jgi:hypothetical protein